MRILLISTYELGRQPFGLASPAAKLRQAGHEVRCLDMAVDPFDEAAVVEADVVAFHLPMHTATRLAIRAAERVRLLNPTARFWFYGLYAPMNAGLLRSIGADLIIGGEFEDVLVDAAAMSNAGDAPFPSPGGGISLARQEFLVPDRSDLQPPSAYAHLTMPDGSHRVVGSTEATRGCKHRCRHCPIVPVYDGIFRVVPVDVVLADIGQQVEAGAEHITFGDPDFFNGPRHAVRIVDELHRRWPHLTYDVTIKIEHLLRHEDLLPVLARTGCIMVTSAVEAVDDRILAILDKRHTRADFERAVEACRAAGLTIVPTFVAFTPWISLEGYRDLLRTIARLDLVQHVAPVQYAIRLLIPEGSRLLELPETHAVIDRFDPESLAYPWRHPDPQVDALAAEVSAIAQAAGAVDADRLDVFERVWAATCEAIGDGEPCPADRRSSLALPVPRMSEPWYCCAEPTELQMATVRVV